MARSADRFARVEKPTPFIQSIANALGVTIPPLLLLQADRMIE